MDLARRLKISHKVGILAAIAVLGFAAYLINNILVQQQSQFSIEQIRDQYFPALDTATVAQNTLYNIDQLLQTAVTTGEEESLESADTQQQLLSSKLNELLEILPSARKEVTHLQSLLNNYYGQARSIALSLVDGSADFATLPAKAERSAAILQELTTGIANLRANTEQAFNQTIDGTISSSQSAVTTGIMLGVVTIVIVIFVGIMTTKSIVNSIAQVTSSLREIAEGEGDLTVRVDYDGKDEIATLVHWFNQFISKMQISIATTTETVQALQDVSTRLMETSKHTASSIESQNHSVDAVSAAIQEMTSSVHHIADFASQASEEASSANGTAQEGNQVVENTISVINDLAEEVNSTAKAINQLEAYTSNVGVILDAIRGIAEQTNLLALNAAIEAARAGEQGRGFAVVADEVRTLASRTQDSTQEIQQVLEELQKGSGSAVEAMNRGIEQAGLSVEQSAQAGKSLMDITGKVESIHAVNEQIAAATEQQTKTSDLIHNSVNDIQQISLAVAKSSSEIDNVSEDVRQVTQRLSEVISQFKV
ncbi:MULTISPECIES: methyl-accepting chemotaxis protein [unclassified Agarivorans]|uniref:methyl-accepting chemotaxis protein n=1 Tax=unclassified Agarivorans TaxID=2636026 RepID=UPI0026E396B3|nr:MULTISPECIES: HAMP domain-containing methyl-accepting chemotaxis protein [unclassified Agarivorans]MDO6688003.1 HAMP domain-containing methyl-accepting chemotaxis protein [Agarivorans sp. 3_MG-2023]MDO6715270.1 HAMP domain-containing methyl-accepting chemotaxis protein [Agarivorans sp. 2_MG-2023]MDO6763433.1 HAMP domain-containing methyl-accepting chemotaxis protein [Agarivorans sp. 1_MG-2023]